MSKKKKCYIALNEGANSFTDPTSLLNLSGKMVKEISKSLKDSFYIKRAIRAGHLKEVTLEEFEKYQDLSKSEKKLSAKKSDSEAYIKQLKSQLTDVVDERDSLIKRNELLEKENDSLKEQLKEEEEEEDDSIDFDEMNKGEIKEYLNQHFELTQEDIDKMDSLNKQPLVEFANQILSDNEEE